MLFGWLSPREVWALKMEVWRVNEENLRLRREVSWLTNTLTRTVQPPPIVVSSPHCQKCGVDLIPDEGGI